jgi:hypothetical protein
MAEESSPAEIRNKALDRPSELYKHLVEGLPPELFFRTLEFVEAKSIISMLTGNKELHSLVDGTFEYQSSRFVDALEEIAKRFSGYNNEQETRKAFSEGLPNNDPGPLRSLFGRLSDTARSIPNIPKRVEAIGMIAKMAGVLEGEQLSKRFDCSMMPSFKSRKQDGAPRE